MNNVQYSEVVSPAHPDRIADRIAGALVDLAYSKSTEATMAAEVMVGHGKAYVIVETSENIKQSEVIQICQRICPDIKSVEFDCYKQDEKLAKNQSQKHTYCGDQGLFAGYPMPKIHSEAKKLAQAIYKKYPYDGKLVLTSDKDGVVSWSNVPAAELYDFCQELLGYKLLANPIGDWAGGINVDTGLTGRKLACDFYSVERPLGGGAMWNKDLTKADVSVNIYCFMLAQEKNMAVKAKCAIGDYAVTFVFEDGSEKTVLFDEIVSKAGDWVTYHGGFEKCAEYGLVVD